MCIYCLYLFRRQKSLNHSAIHLTCLYMSSSCVIHVYVICCQLVCLLIMYVYCMYLSWRHGRTAPWPSCLSRLKNLSKKNKKTIYLTCIILRPYLILVESFKLFDPYTSEKSLSTEVRMDGQRSNYMAPPFGLGVNKPGEDNQAASLNR